MVFKKVDFFNNLSFSEKLHKYFVSASGGLLVISATISQAVLNLRYSCTSPVLCWSLRLQSISISIAWEKKVLGCHKFCSSMSSIGWFSTGLNQIFLAKSALKLYFHWKKMSQWTPCEKWKHSYQYCLSYGQKSADTATSYWSPLMRFRVMKIDNCNLSGGVLDENLRVFKLVRHTSTKQHFGWKDTPSSKP